MPVFLSTPKSDAAAALPLQFTGGLALSTRKIGFMLAVQGIYSMIAQLWLFPLIVRHFGTLRTFRFVLMVWPPLYFMVPYLVLLPSSLQIPAVYVALLSKITFHVIAFPSSAILLANAAPSMTVLGSINGVAASTASLSRALGPTITGLLHSRGLQSGYSVLAWWVCGIVCVMGAIESCFIEEVDPRRRNATDNLGTGEQKAQGSQRRGSFFTFRERDAIPEEEVRLLSSARTSSDLGSEVSDVNLTIDHEYGKA
jgi:hypothetical protein